MTMPDTAVNDPRWLQVLARDKQADGRFVYAVRTTGIYCRPSCPSRRAHPDHVVFFATVAEAAAAGYRACQRCRPDGDSDQQQWAARITAACRQLEHAETEPTLHQLAAQAGVSPWHFHRRFRALTGFTPRAYAAARRGQRVRDALPQAASVTEALYGAGYGSSGRFYAASEAQLGMTPGQFRRGGQGEQLWFAVGECSLGSVLVAQSARGVCAILLGDDPQALVRQMEACFPQAEFRGADQGFEQGVAQVIGLIDHPQTGLTLPLDIRGTLFQQRVWQALRAIPPGSTLSYREIAARIGAPAAVRAVAGACAANRLAVAIPCHRVVKQDGSLSGYRWGVERKRALLLKERAAEKEEHVPDADDHAGSV
ncbi:bifunctional DNA-binding transcriptional regulator/O6-methylguanine-DNA methyltransferase Ada [Chimaeribacter arupi]|uniref:methylated-DNA--[protein]-cysteine S-methyltransferase n=1 Tax=Chimaeribacter arupi TaxID=2060066 RepID=A0A2N5EJF2_9GAMM|nr:bifunctional DNA-binding transcriptional regulator/O6-methylguanine-DNA methyltransferase Ada [Chimaeribacter arupi]PLR45704.1 bifunctional DNA-binding transcriptional regulator/O6-methylguanine-DNA methyltransferase Ada [Chimaeribacter arupi]